MNDKFIFNNNNIIINNNNIFNDILTNNCNVNELILIDYQVNENEIEFNIDLIINKKYSIISLIVNDVILKIKFNEKNNFDDKYNTKIVLPNNIDMNLFYKYEIKNFNNKNDLIKLYFFKNL